MAAISFELVQRFILAKKKFGVRGILRFVLDKETLVDLGKKAL